MAVDDKVSERLGLPIIIDGLVSDLQELRAGTITVNDATARALLAKQIFNGVRLYVNGMRLLSKEQPAENAASMPEGTGLCIDQ